MSNRVTALSEGDTLTQSVSKSEMDTAEGDTLTQSVSKSEMDTTEGDTLTQVNAGRLPMKLASERQIYDALHLIGNGSVSLSARKISKITGLRITKFTSLHKEYLLAKSLGTNVKGIINVVLNAYNTCSLLLEYHFSALVIQELLDRQKFEHARFFLCLDGNFLKFINIHYSKICDLTEDTIRNKLEVISLKYKISFCHNNKTGGNHEENQDRNAR